MFKKILGSCLFLMSGFWAGAQLKLPRLCSDGMVLQSSQPVPVWGWAEKGSTVHVSFRGKQYHARAGADGRWRVSLPALSSGGPDQMLIASGKQKILIRDILVGQVWVLSGQSNMEHDLNSVVEKYPSLLADSSYEAIRQFKVPGTYNFKQEQKDYPAGSWTAATHEKIGAFTAVGFFFAQQLYHDTHQPVGIINISLGGSPIEAWLPESALKKYPEDEAELLRFKNDSLIAAVEQGDQKKAAAWAAGLNRQDKGEHQGWQRLDIHSAEVNGWFSMSVPGYWADQGLGQVNGVVWLKKSVLLRHPLTAKKARLMLGRIVDADSVFVNGVYVGSTTYQYPRRRYDFNADVLHEGINTVTIRLVSQADKGGLVPDKPYALVLDQDTVSLAGRWKIKVGAARAPAPGQTFVRWKPGGLYNAMMAPAFSYGVKGVIWYQGESNTDNAPEYALKLKDLLAALRAGWHSESLPFLVVQLPNFMTESWDAGASSAWAALRQAQLSILSQPRTDVAVTLGLGEWNDVHPYNKKPVGERLFLLAKDMCYSGAGLNGASFVPLHHSPVARDAQLLGDSVVIHFRSPQPLRIRPGDSSLDHFALAGADGKYYWAHAEIKGDQVWVHSPQVKVPRSVRYGWSDNPLRANLENMAGLPAAPFELTVKE
ncbi:sialate O-acetylesterase [Arachidicoccus rhizosphaerae]|uniref:Sialate O-acetylesterase n=1 Tax=Arachidicoccus rhizosphaerae TaxID=551991 RepID=A0A1H3VEK4_9BACT|nr:sialate O-acetylesterase [Arachidicoccus rhizosphaerae]SDZ73225.1 sialate O-acetylesterase [Arachidicoccus rhizosphaerae]